MITLFIDTTSNQLVAGLNNPGLVSAQNLPFFVGDTLQMQVYLLANAGPVGMGASPYTVVPNVGLTLLCYLTDGTVGGEIYTSQVNFVADPGGQFFSGSLPLNTAALDTLINAGAPATATLIIGFIANGVNTTVLAQKVNINIGMPNNAVVVPPGLTPLSYEAANQEFVKVIGNPGQAIILVSAAGKEISLIAVDRPDGTASFEANPIN